MLVAFLIFFLLEMGVTNVGSQKRLVYLFMDHPWRVEAVIHILFLWFPISMSLWIYQGVSAGIDSSGWSMIVLFLVGWPVLSVVMHQKLQEYQQTLGIGQKKEYDPIFIAKLNVLIWGISACVFFGGLFAIAGDFLPEVRYALSTLGSLGMIFIPFRKSLADVRNTEETTEDEFFLE
ncbi:MAG: hypothetical protein KGD60_05910 [Candidatus Thorarchaeota archaeon]|nr:hypothetical protein [Candidatus Thorarchaeota archaeon]